MNKKYQVRCTNCNDIQVITPQTELTENLPNKVDIDVELSETIEESKHTPSSKAHSMQKSPQTTCKQCNNERFAVKEV